jgi:hypothetical protein
MDWLEIVSGSPDEKAARCGPQIDQLISDPQRTCAVSELTLIECLNAVHNAWRNTEPRKSGYDETWAREAQAYLLEAVAQERLTIRQSQPRDIEHALMLVTDMTEAGRKFRAWDGVHLRIALQWARQTGDDVDLVTSNGDFQAFVELHPYFSRHVKIIAIT